MNKYIVMICATFVIAVNVYGASSESEYTKGKARGQNMTLYEAAKHGKVATVQALHIAGAEVNMRNKLVLVPFCVAAQHDRVGIVLSLIAAGADLNVRDASGSSPFSWAIRLKQFDNAQALYEAGADATAQETITYSRLRTRNGLVPLHLACREGQVGVVRLLLSNGADANVCDKCSWTPLFEACSYGYGRIVRLLLNAGADVDVRNEDAWTPLHTAARFGHAGIVQILLLNKAEIDTENNTGLTPFQLAVQIAQKRLDKKDMDRARAQPPIIRLFLKKLVAIDQDTAGHISAHIPDWKDMRAKTVGAIREELSGAGLPNYFFNNIILPMVGDGCPEGERREVRPSKRQRTSHT